MERFPGLNIHGSTPMKFCGNTFALPWPEMLLFSITKERHLYSRENFCGTLKNHENRKSLAQQIFPCLQ